MFISIGRLFIHTYFDFLCSIFFFICEQKDCPKEKKTYATKYCTYQAYYPGKERGGERLAGGYGERWVPISERRNWSMGERDDIERNKTSGRSLMKSFIQN